MILEAVKTLLAKGADRDFAKQKGEEKFDSFLVALESGNLSLVKYIFEDVYKEHLGLDGDYLLPGSSYIIQSSPLIIACKSNSLPVVSYLLQKELLQNVYLCLILKNSFGNHLC
ncbi:ankyrin repeat domain-containing protein [Capnocytophaga catalasegens]|uniref:Ankyrin repeat protein n=1 Tax=Capnocytophaga catalasegens TaxID=1004260 RepID=A0AAV5AV68_9FLAO|nr:ankyrin repeat domain-containing protein [Capnocytophaga catalasegens]GIZ16025.1 hypothetical protein RCZ03_20250 [Capnocytophaga catalasegens]GJM51269.1 hypothetical protein RCZ15_22420 [Capnocytophaga catalasegens]GJM53351.1 hypothetical protein RCZ16_16680 [Capnocytophaga catalasegens]